MQFQPGSIKFVIHKKMYSLFSVFFHVGLNIIGFQSFNSVCLHFRPSISSFFFSSCKKPQNVILQPKYCLNVESSLNFHTGPISVAVSYLETESHQDTVFLHQVAQKCTSAVSTHMSAFNHRFRDVLFTPPSSALTLQTQSIQNIWEWPCKAARESAWDNLYIKCGLWKIAISIFRWLGLSITKIGWVTTPCES